MTATQFPTEQKALAIAADVERYLGIKGILWYSVSRVIEAGECKFVKIEASIKVKS